MIERPSRKPKQLSLRFRMWGGTRMGAGRQPAGARAGVPHRPRAELAGLRPIHVLRTPTEVRRAMTYVRDNAKQHAAKRGETYSAGYVDPYSSAASHDLVLPVARTWLLQHGWRRGAGP